MRAKAIIFLLFLAGCDAAPRADPFRATGEVIAFSGGNAGPDGACFTCHGLDGGGDRAQTPRLAGLDPGYLHRQMDDYANGRREHAPMRAIMIRLDGADRGKVAAYYAGLPVPAHATDAEAGGAGAQLYHHGDPVRGIAPCAHCHGDRGEGGGASNPPLAGQPVAFLERQLAAWRESRRVNDPLGEMLAISRRLAPAESRAVAAHAAGLPGAHPQSTRAASP